MFGAQSGTIDYIVQMPHQRYLARLRNQNLSIINKVYGPYIFTKSLAEIKELIIDNIKESFNIVTIRTDNTQIAKVLKYKSLKNEHLYILTVTTGCRLSESTNSAVRDFTYVISKETLKKVLAMNQAMKTYPKLLSIYEETALETIDNRIYV